LQNSLDEFTRRGVKLVAISVDPPQTTREHMSEQGYTYTFLSDEKKEVLKRYDLVHEGGFQGQDISLPAEFLVDAERIVRWRNLTSDYSVRLKAEEAIRVIDELQALNH